MNETVKLILSLSVSGGLLALVLFALKPFMRNRLSKSFQYYIWLVVLLRFIVPLSFGINLMEYAPIGKPPSVEIDNSENTINQGVETVISEIPINQISEFQEQEYTIPYTPGDKIPKGAFMVIDPFKILTDNLLLIWLVGVIISAAWNIPGYLCFIRYVHGAAYAIDIPNCGPKVYKSRFAPTPMLIGAFRPRIYLPDIEYTDEQLDNILLHELTHLRRRDIWLKWFAGLVVSVHWFNPIAYLMRHEFNRACELSCDEGVIRGLDSAAKQSYGDTLISVVAKNRAPVSVMSVTMCEEKKKLKERLAAIMNYKKKTKIAVLITVVLAVAITSGALVFGAQGNWFNFGKQSYYEIAFPYERASDISAGDMTRLIKETTKTTGNIYINPVSQNINLNTDFSFKDVTIEVFITENGGDGYPNYRLYQILILAEGKVMKIYSKNIESVDNSNALVHFDAYWNALSLLPADAIYTAIPKDSPDFISLRYTPYDVYAISSPKIKHIFYNTDGIIDSYHESPSVMFDFIPMYQDENDPNAYEGLGAAILYYYHPQDTEINITAMDEGFDISLSDLRQLAAIGDELLFEDFAPYEGADVGFGLYILHFNVEGGYSLLIGGGEASGKPMYARLSTEPKSDEYIDIRYSDVDKFIKTHPSHLTTRGDDTLRVVTSVTVDHSLNWNNMYPRIYTSEEKINAVLVYIDGLNLKDNFPENPNEYNGSTSMITISYDDGTKDVYYHFGNMFFGKENENGIDWKRMEYKEAAEFDTIIQNNLSD